MRRPAKNRDALLPRRQALCALGLAPAAIGLGACGTAGTQDDGGTQRSDGLTPTPACPDGAPTQAQTEGPFWKPSSPERGSFIEPGTTGARLVLEGAVVSRACRPVERAVVDLWHCDAAGVYDNDGFRWRGHVFTDASGRYRFETIVPGEYPGRTRHFHVKVQAPGRSVLTTQLYFPGEPANARDAIFRPELIVQVDTGPEGQVVAFTFVLNV